MRPETPRSRRERGPKGRVVDDAALADVRALLGARERRRDLLIEHLHLIQDKFGCLEARHIRALAEEMRLSQAEVYEVASFYDHFDIIKEGEAKPAPLTIRVCESISCMIAGADQLIESLSAGVDPQQVRVVRAACVGRCATAPAARIGDREVDNATVEGLLRDARERRTDVVVPPYIALDEYRKNGGYELYESVRTGKLAAEAIIEKLQSSGLRGLGGAGFPPGKKWQFVRSYAGPRLMSINGDEGEPGTFKDRWFLERDPHRTLEGALIAAHAVEAQRIYFYMRNEYPAVLEILRREIAALEAAGIAPPRIHRASARRGRLHLRRRERDDREHRRQTRLAAQSPAVHRRGRHLRPPDAEPERRDALVDPRHPAERCRLVRQAGQGRPSGPAIVVGVGARQEARRRPGAGRCHGA